MASLTLLRFSPPSRFHLAGAPSPSLPSVLLRLRPSLPVRRSPIVSMSYSSPVPATDRLVSALAYTLPFSGSLSYGSFLLARVPAAAAAVAPILPLVSAYRAVPYGTFVAFFALFLGVVRNSAFSRYVRFNAMQALVLDILLSLPILLQPVFGTPSSRAGLRIMMMGYNGVFVLSFICFVYSVISCVFGRTPHLPVVGTAANHQLSA